ncbi:hypothetical protein MHYP_G00261440 [Metynnis hypsauchen]
MPRRQREVQEAGERLPEKGGICHSRQLFSSLNSCRQKELDRRRMQRRHQPSQRCSTDRMPSGLGPNDSSVDDATKTAPFFPSSVIDQNGQELFPPIMPGSMRRSPH